MDKNSHWHEIIDLVRLHKQKIHPVDPLPTNRMAQLEADVFTHIDQLFPENDVTPASAQNSTSTKAHPNDDVQHKTSLEQGKSFWMRLFQSRFLPGFALTMFALISAGVLTFHFSVDSLPTPLYDIPQLVLESDVDLHIQLPQEGSRALTGTMPSERRSAFLTGVTQAALDLIGDSETPAAHQLALWYQLTVSNDSTINTLEALKEIRSSVIHFTASEQTRSWLKNGYALEVVHLAAKRTLVDLNPDVLIDALQFYKVHAVMPKTGEVELEKTERISSGADVARQYIHNHEKLLVANLAQSPTPEEVQEIIDITRDMKVLLQ